MYVNDFISRIKRIIWIIVSLIVAVLLGVTNVMVKRYNYQLKQKMYILQIKHENLYKSNQLLTAQLNSMSSKMREHIERLGYKAVQKDDLIDV